MGAHLHHALKAFCSDTEWKYAVFWKLKHQARMMLTWEDAYYDNHELCDPPENICFTEKGGYLSDRHAHDPLGLAVAKMSCHVAVTRKHMWIFADKLVTDSCSPFENYDGWQTQFSSGIKTIVVVAVVPHGVVQLGSLKKIPENFKVVNYIRDLIFSLLGSSVWCTPSAICCTMGSPSCLSDIYTRSSGSGNFHNCISNIGRPVNKDKTIIRSPTFSSTGELVYCSCADAKPGELLKKTVEVSNNDGGLELSTPGGDEINNLLQSRSNILFSEQQKQVLTRLDNDRKCEGETSCSGYLGVSPEDQDPRFSHCSFNKVNLCNVTLPDDDSAMNLFYSQSDLLDSSACNNQNGMLCIPEPFDMQIQKVLENNIDFPTEINNMKPLNMPFKFSAGCELYEVLGPAFRKQSSCCDWEEEKTVTETDTEMPERMENSSLLTADAGMEHLLEAVVANVCRSESDVKSEKSFCKSVKSMLATEKMPQPTFDELTVGSAGYSFDQSLVEKNKLHCLSSETCSVSSSKGFSSRSCSTCSEQLDSAQEPAKINRKRARVGESRRPRPRDRQLIQDRIKELRELMPSGAKCSIDSLLECTIKHMLFMQSIAKHADKVYTCTKSKDKETVLRGLPRYDQGSSWAMDIFCEGCCHFLEITEAIRSMDLTILKGVTEACEKKTRMCFVVELMPRANAVSVRKAILITSPEDDRRAEKQKDASDGYFVVTCADIAIQDNGLVAKTITDWESYEWNILY
ncbi:Transcription factor like [Actinidia chinensis var. chinensis]|uniref:Transcription factor like n=1 Tax=Actinidia chinensis var. chinensis TaxID=1590841 RepID=A0A2R6PP84_ACTCC|nr:Transcription factor like [Actinidia chinensis var. chinensis]